jgi:CRP-like cAMP-binding protein
MTEVFDTLRNHLTRAFSVPPLEWVHLAKHLRLKSLKKGEAFFRQGEPVDEIGFVIKGLLYNYFTSESGDKFVKYFIPDRGFVACYSSLVTERPALFSCETLEPTTLITIRYQDVLKLYDRHICWERMGRKKAEELFVEKEVREMLFLTSDATARYEVFVRENQDLVNRVPQYLIASYIGISPVSLSRIRQK